MKEQYYGEIDLDVARLIMSTNPINKYSINGLSTDCKITNTELTEDLGFWAHYGNPDGSIWKPANDLKEKLQGITEIRPLGWVKIYASKNQHVKLSPNRKTNEVEVNCEILWSETTENTEFIRTLTNNGEAEFNSHKSSDFSSQSNVKKQCVYIKSDKSCIAFDISKKQAMWDFETEGKITSSPSSDDESVFFGSWDGNIYALDKKNGDLKWKYETGWGVETTPYMTGDAVYAGSLDNNFYALDKKTGKHLWHFTCNAAIHSSPTVYGKYVFFGCDDGNFYALNKTTGQVGWVFSPDLTINNDVTNYLTTPITSDPVVENGIVYIDIGGITYALSAQTFEESKKENIDTEFGNQNLHLLLIVIVLILLLIIIRSLRSKK